MLSTLCLFAIHTQAPIDFEVSASRLPVVIEALSQKTGEKLFCSPELGRQVLVVKFSGVTSAEAKAKIAEATDAEWADRNGTLTLLRTPGKQRELDSKWNAALEKPMLDALGELTDQLGKQPKFGAMSAKKLLDELNAGDAKSEDEEQRGYRDWQAKEKVMARGPGGRAVARTLALLGAKELTTIPVGRTVYATNPTNLQRPLPRAIDGILKAWDEDQRIWEKTLQSNPPEKPSGGWSSSDPRFSVYGDNRANRVLMVARRYGPKANIQFTLTGYDASGKTQFSSSTNLVPKWALQTADFQKAILEAVANGNYTLSKESQTKIAHGSLDYAKDLRPTAEEAKVYADPVARDPLSYEHSELLLALAKESKRNLIASINDSLQIPGGGGEQADKPINLNGYLKYNEQMGNIEVARDDKWIQIKPFAKQGPPQLPDDRFAARKLILSGLQVGYFTLDALAEFAQSADSQWNAVAFYLARILMPRTERLLQEMDEKALKFYGTLSPVQRRTLTQGGTVPLNNLGSAAKKGLMEFALSGDTDNPASGLFVKGQNTFMSLHNDLSAEPTEYLARGTGGDVMTSTIKMDDDLLVGTKSSKYVAWTRFIKPEQLASQFNKPDGVFSKDDDFWTGSIFRMKLTLGLAPETELRLELKEHRYDMRKTPMRLEQMPDDIKKRISAGG